MEVLFTFRETGQILGAYTGKFSEYKASLVPRSISCIVYTALAAESRESGTLLGM